MMKGRYRSSKYNSQENGILIIDVYKETFLIIIIPCINNKKIFKITS